MIVQIAAVIALAVIGFSAFLFFAQERMIFYRTPAPAALPRAGSGDLDEVVIDSADGHRLVGWLVTPAAAGEQRPARRVPVPLLIYFGGNAEDVSWMIGFAHRFAGHAVLLVNYRGYGPSRGTPGERALFEDALRWYDHAGQRSGIDPGRIAVMGRSLGSGVAVHVAARRRVSAVLLVSPYDSVRAVAQAVYPFVPVRQLLRHPFDSLSLAGAIAAPLLCIVAQDDRVIPSAHSRRLYEGWGGAERVWRELPGDHDSVSAQARYWDELEAFLRRLGTGRDRTG